MRALDACVYLRINKNVVEKHTELTLYDRQCTSKERSAVANGQWRRMVSVTGGPLSPCLVGLSCLVGDLQTMPEVRYTKPSTMVPWLSSGVRTFAARHQLAQCKYLCGALFAFVQYRVTST